jgi:heat shock protein HslJ
MMMIWPLICPILGPIGQLDEDACAGCSCSSMDEHLTADVLIDHASQMWAYPDIDGRPNWIYPIKYRP